MVVAIAIILLLLREQLISEREEQWEERVSLNFALFELTATKIKIKL